MNEKLREIIESATVDGAKEVYANYENYIKDCSDAKSAFEEKLKELSEQYAEVIKMHDIVESVKKSITEKLNPTSKENN